MSQEPTFPPLMYGEAAPNDVFEHAVQRAVSGCEAGLVAYRLDVHEMQAALVFAPEVPLRDAMAMLPLCGVGFQNALGALAPPEVAVHLTWDGGILVNGASCGAFRVIGPEVDPGEVPDWLVVGFTLPLLPGTPDMGTMPDRTALYAEGCSEVEPPLLVEAWARHTLNWITRWETDGPRMLHSEWRGLAHGVGEPGTQGGHEGTFLGVDESFGMLLRDDATTHLIPLTDILETSP